MFAGNVDGLSVCAAGRQSMLRYADNLDGFILDSNTLDRLVKRQHLAWLVILHLLFLGFGPIHRRVLGEAFALRHLTGTFPILPNRIGNALDFIVRCSDDQDRTRLALQISYRRSFPVGAADFLRAQAPIHLPDSAHGFELAETFPWVIPQSFHSFAVLGVGLPLHLAQGNTIQF